VNVKIPLLATATAVGFTVMVPSPSAGQMTLNGDEVTVARVVGLPWITSVAVKLAGPADPGGVACTSSVKLFAPRYSTTVNWVPVAVPVAAAVVQAEGVQARSDGEDAVQPCGMDRVTVIVGSAATKIAGVGEVVGGNGAGAVKVKVRIVATEAVTIPEGETSSVPVSAWAPDTAANPTAAAAGQGRAAAPTTATATAPTPHHRRDRHMPAPTRERQIPFSRRGRPDR
jgi:hypothetical protein